MLSLTAAAVVLAAASGGEPFTRTCGSRAEGPSPTYEVRPAHDVVLGRVTFIGLKDRIQLASSGRGDRTAKVGAVVNTGSPVTVRIRPLERTRARLNFDNHASRTPRRVARGDGQRAVRFEPCRPDTPRFTDGRPVGDQTMFPGGFLIARPGCARLTARSPGEQPVRRRVALGVAPRRCR